MPKSENESKEMRSLEMLIANLSCDFFDEGFE